MVRGVEENIEILTVQHRMWGCGNVEHRMHMDSQRVCRTSCAVRILDDAYWLIEENRSRMATPHLRLWSVMLDSKRNKATVGI